MIIFLRLRFSFFWWFVFIFGVVETLIPYFASKWRPKYLLSPCVFPPARVCVCVYRVRYEGWKEECSKKRERGRKESYGDTRAGNNSYAPQWMKQSWIQVKQRVFGLGDCGQCVGTAAGAKVLMAAGGDTCADESGGHVIQRKTDIKWVYTVNSHVATVAEHLYV